MYNQKNRIAPVENFAKTKRTSPLQYKASDAPAVVVLESYKEGLLKVKVESDIMAYILYCHYDEFTKIQQAFRVAITWSGIDNTVMFCLTAQGDPTRLHLAAQRFLSFYYHIASNLVAAPLNNHVANITLHQYHRAIYAVKKNYSKAMIKDVKSSGRIVLYSPPNILNDAKTTFLSALNVSELPEDISETKRLLSKSSMPISTFQRSKTLPIQNFEENHSMSFTNGHHSTPSMSHSNLMSTSKAGLTKKQDFSRGKCHSGSHERILSYFDVTHNAMSSSRHSEGNSSSTYTSSGYGSTPGALRHQLKEEKIKSYSDNFLETGQNILPPIPQKDVLDSRKPGRTVTFSRLTPTSLPRQYAVVSELDYYYDDIQHSGDPLDGETGNQDFNLNCIKQNYYNGNHGPSSTFVPNYNTTLSSPTNIARCSVSPQFQKTSFIPKLQTAFHFKQNHKKCFEWITPTGVTIEVHEGDVTDSDCDVVVNVTNSQLHVNGELAWAVAKHGSFDIPKLTKLHVAMNGPVAESKVVVTPSVGLPSVHLIHAVAPKWSNSDLKKSKRLLYNTYKNIFSKASLDLQATSIALPVIGLQKSFTLEESFPYHIATEVMYQSLIAFLKIGSVSLRNIRYIDNDPHHVNLIITSIKPKIENVTYDTRKSNPKACSDNDAAAEQICDTSLLSATVNNTTLYRFLDQQTRRDSLKNYQQHDFQHSEYSPPPHDMMFSPTSVHNNTFNNNTTVLNKICRIHGPKH